MRYPRCTAFKVTPVARSSRSSTAVQFSRGGNRSRLRSYCAVTRLDVCAISQRGGKKEDTVVTSRSGERNELYHTAGISIGKRVPREKTLLSILSRHFYTGSCHLRSSPLRAVGRDNRNSTDPRAFGRVSRCENIYQLRRATLAAGPRTTTRHFAGEGWMVHLNFVKCT